MDSRSLTVNRSSEESTPVKELGDLLLSDDDSDDADNEGGLKVSGNGVNIANHDQGTIPSIIGGSTAELGDFDSIPEALTAAQVTAALVAATRQNLNESLTLFQFGSVKATAARELNVPTSFWGEKRGADDWYYRNNNIIKVAVVSE